MAQVVLAQGPSQATPPANTVAIYAKTDGAIYAKNPAGVETALGIAGAGSGTVTSVSGTNANGYTFSISNPTVNPNITLGTSLTGMLKGNGTAMVVATPSTDYAPPTTGNSILYANGSGGFAAVTIGANLTFSAGTLAATGGGGMVYPGAGIPNSTGAAWGTSYTTSGSGTVIPLATGATFVNPTLGTPASVTLTNGTGLPISTGLTGLGTNTATILGTNPTSAGSVGYLDIPQNSKSAAYTTVLSDSGKHILHPSADTTARTFTIDSNANVAYPIGTAITFVNQNAAGVLTISITTDTMRLAGAGTTGSRTLAANGIATALKITATEWIISGTGLT